MAEQYESIMLDGQVVGRRLVSDGEAAPPTSWFIPEKEFMGRWTLEELTKFYALKATDPTVAAADALVTRLGGVQNDSQRTQMLMGYLVQKAVVTAERVPVLLARPA